MSSIKTLAGRAACALALGVSGPASALEYSFDLFGERIDAVLNNTVTFGASWRLQDPAADLIGKSNLDPDVCAGAFQSCIARRSIRPSVCAMHRAWRR